MVPIIDMFAHGDDRNAGNRVACAPAFARAASAGGQLEHPSDVNSSTRTGWSGLRRKGTQEPGASTNALQNFNVPTILMNALLPDLMQKPSQFFRNLSTARRDPKTSPSRPPRRARPQSGTRRHPLREAMPPKPITGIFTALAA